jgi:hypothetical protein
VVLPTLPGGVQQEPVANHPSCPTISPFFRLQEHVNSFVSEALDDWEGKEGFNYVQVSHPSRSSQMLDPTFLNFFNLLCYRSTINLTPSSLSYSSSSCRV